MSRRIQPARVTRTVITEHRADGDQTYEAHDSYVDPRAAENITLLDLAVVVGFRTRTVTYAFATVEDAGEAFELLNKFANKG